MNKTLKSLIQAGRVTKDVQLYGRTWTMHTLDTRDQLVASNSTSDYDALSRVMALKVAMLAHAIDKVDGESLGTTGEKRDVLGRLQVPVLNALYAEYEKLLDKQNNDLNDLNKDRDLLDSSTDDKDEDDEEDLPGL